MPFGLRTKAADFRASLINFAFVFISDILDANADERKHREQIFLILQNQSFSRVCAVSGCHHSLVPIHAHFFEILQPLTKALRRIDKVLLDSISSKNATNS